MNRELPVTQHPTTEEGLRARIADLEAEVDRLRGRPSTEDLIKACQNIGYDLTCATCAAIFWTGFALPHDVHTCPLARRPREIQQGDTVAVDPMTTSRYRVLAVTKMAKLALITERGDVPQSMPCPLTSLVLVKQASVFQELPEP